jgi:hypothetical protein
VPLDDVIDCRLTKLPISSLPLPLLLLVLLLLVLLLLVLLLLVLLLLVLLLALQTVLSLSLPLSVSSPSGSSKGVCGEAGL